MTETCFRMKGTTLTSIVLEVIDFEPDNFETQLSKKVASAPQFFTRSSLILHLIKAFVCYRVRIASGTLPSFAIAAYGGEKVKWQS